MKDKCLDCNRRHVTRVWHRDDPFFYFECEQGHAWKRLVTLEELQDILTKKVRPVTDDFQNVFTLKDLH